MMTTATQRSEILSGCLPAGAVATSFTAEVAAAAAGLRAVYDLTTMETDVVLVTDSLSLVDALRGDPYRISPDTIAAFDALTEVARKAHSINLVWISSHCGVALNDKADRLARNGDSVYRPRFSYLSKLPRLQFGLQPHTPGHYSTPASFAALHPRA